jgi:dTDP-4-amino-4,6-dideoxygalactose transaminase
MHLALVALGIGPGDEVITTPITFPATINVIIQAGARPVLADVCAEDLCLDPAAVERAITPRTRAIMPQHHAGSVCRMAELTALAQRHGLRIVEDAAHAIGCREGERHAGTFGDCGVFSFYPNKNVTTGRGGMIVTDDDAFAERCRLLALHGLSRDAWDRYTERGSWAYQVLAAGYNYAMSDYQAALGHAQFARIDEFQAKRRALAERYEERLAGVSGVVRPAEREGTTHAWHLYQVRLHGDGMGIDRDRFIDELRERGIGTSVHFIPMHHHPYYRETFGWAPGDYPVADEAFASLVSLPLYTRMTTAEVDRVARAVEEIAAANRA